MEAMIANIGRRIISLLVLISSPCGLLVTFEAAITAVPAHFLELTLQVDLIKRTIWYDPDL